MNTHLPPQWRQRVMAIVNGKGWLTGSFGHEQMRLLLAWQRAEGGLADWDPLNTTLHVVQGTAVKHDPADSRNLVVVDAVSWNGSDYNTAGVAEYLKPTLGCMAIAATLLNGFYNGILGFLQGGSITAEEAVNKYADEFRTWGTNPKVILDCLASIS